MMHRQKVAILFKQTHSEGNGEGQLVKCLGIWF